MSRQQTINLDSQPQIAGSPVGRRKVSPHLLDNPASFSDKLAAAAAAVEQLLANSHELAALHTAAEEADDWKGVKTADRRWQASRRAVEKAMERLIDMPVSSVDEAIAKVTAYLRAEAAHLCGETKALRAKAALNYLEDQDCSPVGIAAVVRAFLTDLPKIAAPKSPPRTWDELIADFDAERGKEALAAYARKRQAAGSSVIAFADEMIAASELRERYDRLGEVFAISKATSANLTQAEVEIALERIEAGGSSTDAFDAAVAGRSHLSRWLWSTGHDAYQAAKAAMDLAETDEAIDACLDAQEAWEALTPPDTEALVQVMKTSLTSAGALSFTWQSADCPRSMRDLLDSGDPAKGALARTYMHLLRMTGSNSPVLCTPPIAGLFPRFDPNEVESDDLTAAWEAHHRLAAPYPRRVKEFAEWIAPEFDVAISDPGAMQYLWHYGAALSVRAQEVVTEYEAHGGGFNLVREADGGVLFGTRFARDNSPEARFIEELMTRHAALRRAVSSVIERRDGIVGDPPAGRDLIAAE